MTTDNPRITLGNSANPGEPVAQADHSRDLYQVIVSNVGTVYSGDDATSARACYDQAKEDSANVIGRAAGESVTLFYKGEPANEYIGVLEHPAPTGQADKPETTEDPDACDCVICRIRRRVEGTPLEAPMLGLLMRVVGTVDTPPPSFAAFSQAMAFIESTGPSLAEGPYEIEQVAGRAFRVDGEDWTAYVYHHDKAWRVSKGNEADTLDQPLKDAMKAYQEAK